MVVMLEPTADCLSRKFTSPMELKLLHLIKFCGFRRLELEMATDVRFHLRVRPSFFTS